MEFLLKFATLPCSTRTEVATHLFLQLQQSLCILVREHIHFLIL